MPWYRNGTVAINSGQTTVIGTDTEFALNARVGDAFQGPDGRWYEVANIASSSVLSILPPYQGETVASGVYGLAPMQGYVKESADRLRQIVEQWGSSIADLGDVATMDVVPIENGGTGAITQAAAREALGLGAVAVRSIVPVTEGGTGSTSQAGARTALGATSVGDALFTAADAAAVRSQAGATTTGSALLTAATPAAARTTLQLKTAALADVVGTVSQSGGVPTGAIIETGSNANGNYTKFADGTMICRRYVADFPINVPVSSVTASGNIAMPATFVGEVSSSISVYPTNAGGALLSAVINNIGLGNTSNWAFSLFNLSGTALTRIAGLSLIAVGRWF